MTTSLSRALATAAAMRSLVAGRCTAVALEPDARGMRDAHGAARSGRALLEGREHADDVLAFAARMPGSQQIIARVRQRAGQQDAPRRGERQQVRVVLQQHDGLAGNVARGGAMFLRDTHAFLEVLRHVGFFEQPEAPLEGERAQHFAIDFLDAHQIALDGLGELREVDAVFHVDGHGAVAQRLHRRLQIVGGRAVIAQSP